MILRLQLSYRLFQAMPTFRTLKSDNASTNIGHRRMLSMSIQCRFACQSGHNAHPLACQSDRKKNDIANQRKPRTSEGRAGRFHVLICPMGRRDYTLPNEHSSGINPLAQLKARHIRHIEMRHGYPGCAQLKRRRRYAAFLTDPRQAINSSSGKSRPQSALQRCRRHYVLDHDPIMALPPVDVTCQCSRIETSTARSGKCAERNDRKCPRPGGI